MNLRHTAALALVTCVLSLPATSPLGHATFVYGISRAECEAQALKSPVGYFGEKAHCGCSDGAHSPKAIPTPRVEIETKPLAP
jgi:hypothetical protein